MPYPLPLTRTEAYLAYKAGVITAESLKPSLSVPRTGIDAWLAYWTGLNNDYPKDGNGDPLCLTQEEAYVAYLSGVLNEYPENALHRVSAYLRYLISARWGRPDHPLNREELYLSLLKTQVIPSGDPSSDIEINGTAKAPFQDLKMYGNTTQQTYTGINLFNKNASQAPNARCTGTLSGDTFTITATQANTGYYSIIIPNSSDLLGKTCIISYSAASSVGSGRLRVFATMSSAPQSVTTEYADNQGDGSQTVAVTFPSAYPTNSDCFAIVLYSTNQGGSTVIGDNSKYSNIQLEVGSAASPYQPYTGGQASPNPDYPQTIQTVTGTQTVTVEGKNLFDGVFELGNIATATGDNVDANTMIRSKNYCEIKPSTQYTISVVDGGNVALRFYQADGTFIGTGMTGTSPNTFTSPENAGRVRFIITSNTNLNTKAQCEKGSSATAWTPYYEPVSYPLNLGSIELCKLGTYQDYIYKDGEDWKVHKDIGKYTFVGTESWSWDITIPRIYYSQNQLANIGVYPAMPVNTSTLPTALTTKFNGKTFDDFYTNRESNGFAMSTNGKNWNFGEKSWTSSEDAVEDVTGTTVYYALLSAYKTDTVITDANLIAQLDALVNGGAENGTTYIKVSATDPNLPGLLYVEAPKYE